MNAYIDQSSKPAVVKDQRLTFRELLGAILKQWKWILLSLVLCMGIAVLYLAWKPVTYTRSAQVEIKEDSESGSSAALAMFADLGIGQSLQ